MMLHTNLRLLKEAGACTKRYRVLCKALGGAKKYGYNTPISFKFIVESNGLDDTLWALRAAKCDKLRNKVARLFAVGCGYMVLDNYERRYPTDKRVRMCLESACLYAFGELTDEELYAAWSAARSAAWSTDESTDESAAESAAWSAARSAAESAAWSAAAESAAWSAESAAWSAAESAAARSAARFAARFAARSAAWSAAKGEQTKLFLRLLEEITE